MTVISRWDRLCPTCFAYTFQACFGDNPKWFDGCFLPQKLANGPSCVPLGPLHDRASGKAGCWARIFCLERLRSLPKPEFCLILTSSQYPSVESLSTSLESYCGTPPMLFSGSSGGFRVDVPEIMKPELVSWESEFDIQDVGMMFRKMYASVQVLKVSAMASLDRGNSCLQFMDSKWTNFDWVHGFIARYRWKRCIRISEA